MMTFLLLDLLQKQGTGGLGLATCIAMLISVGTFIYVSTMHILPEVFPRQHDHSEA